MPHSLLHVLKVGATRLFGWHLKWYNFPHWLYVWQAATCVRALVSAPVFSTAA